MNMQLREADWRIDEPVQARPPWYIHPLRRRAVLIVAGLLIAAAIAIFYVWYTTMCGNCGPVITCAKRCTKPITLEQIERQKAQDRLSPDPAPQTR